MPIVVSNLETGCQAQKFPFQITTAFRADCSLPAMDRIGNPRQIRWYLKEWRMHLGLTQEQLAERLETNKGQVSKLETGRQRFNDDWIGRCSYALGIEPGDLLRDPSAPDLRTLLLKATPEVRARALKVLDALIKAG